ncbi:DUF6077 domain-containing protein [Turicibacter sanguinis]|uniref:Uncharacterized protein n=1 Tax=Turicibacter sanguinis TaxID=154288 RepID=A0A6G2CJH3_9FIRM|nr:DUF6077 domain-containing protein [Turicibacter sanguinis]MTK68715.1 hypothetical protein [Turicibacter sanguinis]MTK82071.1 hypothetical protein [Turicibacter sanguinis]MTK83174.1 hypothetical protein [Turicibacter sanguinis]MTK86410.1 hypothetical protein [Turicibacter sanguinis]MTK93590.1 hypothetical protein [Turicibacter sanguinis]
MINSIIAMTVFILVLSYAIGKIVSMKLNLSEKLPYAIPLGFFIILGLHQIITLPVMIWHLSSQVLVILTVILGIVLSGYALFKIKLWYRLTWQLDYILIVIMAGVLIYFYANVDSLNYSGEDFNFYIPFVGSNVNAMQVNMINPWSGETGVLNWIYNFQGYYLFLSALSQLLNVDYMLVTLWLPSIIFLIIMPLCLFNAVHYYFKDTHWFMKWVLVGGLFCLVNDTLSGMIYSYYGNQFRPLIMIYLIWIYVASREKETPWSILSLIILMFSHYSVQSTGLFVGGMLVLLLLGFEVFIAKQPNLKLPVTLSIPLAFYVIGIISTMSMLFALIATIILVVLYPLIYWLVQKFSNIMKKIMRFALILLLASILLISIVMTLKGIASPVSMASFIPDYINGITYFTEKSFISYQAILLPLKVIYTLVGWALLIGVLCYRCEVEEYRLYKVILVGTLIFFYNPFVAPFISKYLTGIVYGRTTILLFSLITFAVGVKFYVSLMKSIKAKTILTLGLTAVFGILFINNSVIHAQDFSLKFLINDTTYDPYYKLPYDLIEAEKALVEYKLEYFKEPDYRTTVMSCDLRTRFLYEPQILVFNVATLRDFYMNYDTNPYEYRMFIYSLLTNSKSWAEEEPSVYNDLERRMRAYTIEFVIVPADGDPLLYETLGSFANRIYINNSYVVYHISYLNQ